MSDLIDRQAAIDALCNDYCGGHQDCKHYPKCENLRSIQKLSSAQPEREKGHWILVSEGSMFPFECDQCGEWHNSPSNFCPECGADMRGEQE